MPFLIVFLYISIVFAYTFCVILKVLFFIFVLISIPIKFKLKLLFSIKEKKVFYSIKTLGFFKLNCGYIDINSCDVKLNYSKNKIKFLTIKDLIPNDESVNFIKHFKCIKLSSAFLLGEDVDEYKYYVSAVINSFNPAIYAVLNNFNPYLKFRNDVFLLGENSSGIIAEIIVATNIISIVSIFIKKFANIIIGGNNV